MYPRPLPLPDSRFWKRLENSPRKVLLLDYDGTLAPFREEREKAYPYPGIRETLEAIVDSGHCRVVLISGRWSKDLPPLLNLKHLPEIWGSHGVERVFPDGRYELSQLEDNQIKGLADADDLVESAGLALYREQKPGCLALHWRGRDPEIREKILELGQGKLFPLAESSGLVIKEFDGGMELRTPARGKGDAVRTIFQEEGDDAYGAYLGDDLTDEDAFQAIDGKGLGILVREPFRNTAAKAWIRPSGELMDFLRHWARICG